MTTRGDTKGDFGHTHRPVERTQVAGIYDLVGFTDLASNRDLVQAVSMLENELKFNLNPVFFWDERYRTGDEKSTNDILLRSTGDGYIVVFSQHIEGRAALKHLTEIHARVQKKHSVRLGINIGANYVVADVNERVNIVGWGINLAARALGFAEAGQIICTDHFAKPLIEADKELADTMKTIGERTVKNTKLSLHNYYKSDEFGAALTQAQKQF